jgi:hypothetical protein
MPAVDEEGAAEEGEEEGDACCICLAAYAGGDKVRTLPCRHFFHVK